MRDLDFISGRFQDLPIPKEQQYLFKYFKTPLQKAVLKYYLVFNDTTCFAEHTGYYTSRTYPHRLVLKLQKILEVHAEAKSTMNFEELWKIETGKYRYKYESQELPPKDARHKAKGWVGVGLPLANGKDLRKLGGSTTLQER